MLHNVFMLGTKTLLSRISFFLVSEKTIKRLFTNKNYKWKQGFKHVKDFRLKNTLQLGFEIFG